MKKPENNATSASENKSEKHNSKHHSIWSILLWSLIVVICVSAFLTLIDFLCYLPVGKNFTWLYNLKVVKDSSRSDLFSLIYNIITLSVDILLVVVFEKIRRIEDEEKENAKKISEEQLKQQNRKNQEELTQLYAMDWARALQFNEIKIEEIDRRPYEENNLIEGLKKRLKMKSNEIVRFELISSIIFPIDYKFLLKNIYISYKEGDSDFIDGPASEFTKPIQYSEIIRLPESITDKDAVYDIYSRDSKTVLQFYFPYIDTPDEKLCQRNVLLYSLANRANSSKRLFKMELNGRAHNTFREDLSFDFTLIIQGTRYDGDYNVEKINYERREG